MERASKLARLLAVLLALGWIAIQLRLFLSRVPFPYDLEWMEGGELCRALRLLEGKPIYGPPSVEFISFLYTPLYPAVLALLARGLGLSYLLARIVSATSFLAATVLAFRFAAREGGSRAAALCAMALPMAAFVRTGTFYDLARPDSLWLLLVTAALLLLYRAARDERGRRRDGPLDPRRHAAAAGAGLLLCAAFFTKQTASPFLLAAGAALVLLEWRLVPAFAGALALAGLPALLIANRVTDGWFWKYVFELHQRHDFYAARAFRETPMTFLAFGGVGAGSAWNGILGPAWLLIPWALVRARGGDPAGDVHRPGRAALQYAGWLAAVGIGVSCVAFGTQWAYWNAFIPGVFFPSLAIGLCAGRLTVARPPERVPRLRPAAVYLLLGASLALRAGDVFHVMPGHPLVLAHRDEGVVRPLAPTVEDRRAGERLIEQLRATPGDVLIPFHPFYGHLAGKPTWVHRMGVLDVGRAGMGVPAGLAESIRDHRFTLAIFDDKIAGNWEYWPGILSAYTEVAPPPSPTVVSGAVTRPAHALVPRGANRPASDMVKP